MPTHLTSDGAVMGESLSGYRGITTGVPELADAAIAVGVPELADIAIAVGADG